MIYAECFFNMDDRTSRSQLEEQRRRARKLAKDKGWDICQEIVEKNLQPETGISDRASLWRMLRDADARAFTVLILPGISCLARKQEDRVMILRWLSQHGICIQLLDRGTPYLPAGCNLEAMARKIYANAVDGSDPEDIILENTLDPICCVPDGVIGVYGVFID